MTSGKVVTTVGYERRFNPGLGFDDLDAFGPASAPRTHRISDQDANIDVTPSQETPHQATADVPCCTRDQDFHASASAMLSVRAFLPR